MTCAHVIALMITHSGSIAPLSRHVAVPSRKSTTFSRAWGEEWGPQIPPQKLVLGTSMNTVETTDFHNTYSFFNLGCHLVNTVANKLDNRLFLES